MKKLLIALSVLLCFLPFIATDSFAYADNSQSTYIVTANSAGLFESANFSSTKLKTLTHKTEIIIEVSNGSPVEYKTDEFVFFKATSENQTGYVYSDLVVAKNKTITSIPNFNAQTNKSCNVFLKNDIEFEETEVTLDKHQRIFLYQGFDKNEKYTAISYLKNNQVEYGYIKTEDVSPDGINPIIITCISLIVAIVGIASALILMKNKKIKLKNKSKKIGTDA